MKEALPALKRHARPEPSLMEVALACQRTLLRNPQQPAALVAISVVALASGQSEAAVSMATAATSVAPAMGAAWVALGQALKACGRFGEAEAVYGKAIGLNGADSLARMGLGELELAIGRPDDSIRQFERVLRMRPALAPAHMGRGYGLACLGRNLEALACYEQALALRPRQPEAEFAAGFVLARLGRSSEAETRYRRALAVRPDFAAAWLNLGVLLREQGRDIFAEAALQRAVELRPDLVAGWVNLAQFEREQRRPQRAEEHLRRAFALHPQQVETLLAWCQLRVAENDPAGAWGWLRWTLAQDAEQPEAWNMYGILLHGERRFVEALAAFARAEAHGHRAAVSNRGNSLLEMGREAEALRAHEAAVERDPQCAGALYNLSLTHLRLGNWKQGWQEYEARWRFREVHRRPRHFTQPRWQGEPLAGQRVLLHAEQGLGDTIQFCRYAALVAARGGFPVLQVQAAAERLLQSLAVVRAGRAEVALPRAELPQFDLECPLMSLPAVFGTTIETVPWPGAYLAAEPAMTARKWAQFPGSGAPRLLRVGLAWAGNPRYKADAQRSTKLATFLPLLRMPGVEWISLQKGPPAEQIAALPDDVRLLDGSSQDCDLAETAALVATLDLVVTTDTCIAHLAGAMGKPVWILLAHQADWRWMQRVEATPWYPSARLCRQTAPGDWTGLVERVAERVRTLLTRLPAVPFPAPSEPAS